MLEAAHKAMFAPFQVSLMADPSGAYTTAAAMVASVEAALLAHAGAGFAGRRVVVLGGTGPVGRIAAVLAAQAGARVAISSRNGSATADEAAQQTAQRFGVALEGASGADRAAVRASIAEADVILACAAAGVQVVSAAEVAQARLLRVVADVNAVPPAGVAGVDVTDRAKPIAGTPAVGIGALAIGNIKYQTQQLLLNRMREAGTPQVLGFAEAFEVARQQLAAPLAA
jgi:methylene-tetrahydromethanopterin dehydrogenase